MVVVLAPIVVVIILQYISVSINILYTLNLNLMLYVYYIALKFGQKSLEILGSNLELELFSFWWFCRILQQKVSGPDYVCISMSERGRERFFDNFISSIELVSLNWKISVGVKFDKFHFLMKISLSSPPVLLAMVLQPAWGNDIKNPVPWS